MTDVALSKNLIDYQCHTVRMVMRLINLAVPSVQLCNSP